MKILTKIVFNHEYDKDNRFNGWCYYVKNIFIEIGEEDLYFNKEVCDLSHCKTKLLDKCSEQWKN